MSFDFGQKIRRAFPAIALAVGIACSLAVVRAQDVVLVATPDTISKGSTQPIRITWPVPGVAAPAGLKTAAKVTIGGQEAKIVGTATDQSVTVTPTAMDVFGSAGSADIKVTDSANKILGVSTVHLGAPAPGLVFSHGWLLFYVVLLVLFPFALMWTDILKAYGFARQTREWLLAKFSADKISLDELRIIVADLDTSPPGIPGLARATFAFTLLLLLGVILFHVLVSGHDVPPGIEKILTLLGTALTSIVAFYFGTRAAETGAQNTAAAAAASAGGAKPQPSTVTPDPNHGKPGDPISLKGSGFGTDGGTVKFGTLDVADKDIVWADTEVKVKVPAGSQAGSKVRITLTPKGKPAITTAADGFTVDAP